MMRYQLFVKNYHMRHAHLGQLIRWAATPVIFDEDGIFYVWMARSKMRDAASLAIVDWDCPWRANRSTGWKEQKYHSQWELNVIEREKLEKNRLRKETRKRTRR